MKKVKCVWAYFVKTDDSELKVSACRNCIAKLKLIDGSKSYWLVANEIYCKKINLK